MERLRVPSLDIDTGLGMADGVEEPPSYSSFEGWPQVSQQQVGLVSPETEASKSDTANGLSPVLPTHPHWTKAATNEPTKGFGRGPVVTRSVNPSWKWNRRPDILPEKHMLQHKTPPAADGLSSVDASGTPRQPAPRRKDLRPSPLYSVKGLSGFLERQDAGRDQRPSCPKELEYEAEMGNGKITKGLTLILCDAHDLNLRSWDGTTQQPSRAYLSSKELILHGLAKVEPGKYPKKDHTPAFHRFNKACKALLHSDAFRRERSERDATQHQEKKGSG